MQYAQATGLDLTNLWALLDAEENVVAATLVVPNPGRTAMLFSSHPRTTSDVQYVARLIDHASRRTGNLDVQLAQVLLDPDDSLDLAAYRLGGYDQLAILSYLARPAPTARQAAQPSWPEGVCVVPYCQELREPLLEVLDATYEDTLDCPGLFGLRRTQDILTGHQSTGDFDPSLWSMLQIDGAYMGALLLNPAPAHRSIELVYLGLAKAARGRALGTQLLRHGLAQLAGRRERTINLAVDDRNTPAIQLYHRSGFRPTMRRIALTRSLR
jgi:ribosomal protein S18 acetylase RimI-like enzyme